MLRERQIERERCWNGLAVVVAVSQVYFGKKKAVVIVLVWVNLKKKALLLQHQCASVLSAHINEHSYGQFVSKTSSVRV